MKEMYSAVEEVWAFRELATGNWAMHGKKFPMFKGTGRLDRSKSRVFKFSSVPGMRLSLTSSKHGSEYDTLLNGLHQWQPFPMRNASLICSTSQATAAAYGPLWRVVLPNEGRLMVAPKNDIWFSFERALVALGLGGADPVLYRLNEAIRGARLCLGLQEPTDYAELIALLEDIAAKPAGRVTGLALTTITFVERLQDHKGRIELWLDELLSPLPNGFALVDTESLIQRSDFIDREVWTDSDCLLVDEGAFQEWTNGKFSKDSA